MPSLLGFIIFPKRIAFPIIRTKDAPRIRMPFKDDPKHIRRFPLMPVGGSPEMRYCWNDRMILGCSTTQRTLVSVSPGIEVIDRLIAVRSFHTGEAHQTVESEAGIIPDCRCDRRQTQWRNQNQRFRFAGVEG